MLEINKVHCGDSLLLLKQLPDNSVDSIVTDPTYCLSTSKRFGNSNWENEQYKSEELKKGGSGTTAIACIKNGFRFILTEKEEEYCKIAESRIKPYLKQECLE